VVLLLWLQLGAALQRRSAVTELLGGNFSAAASSLRHVEGEFHDSWQSKLDPLKLFKSQRCQNFYGSSGAHRSAKMAYDRMTQMFRPDHELGILGMQLSSIAPEKRSYQRMSTYEDKAVPEDFAAMTMQDDWCEMFAVRTAERPVKVVTAHAKTSGVQLAMPSIWKCASTSFTSAAQATNKQLHQSFCGGMAFVRSLTLMYGN